jgi:glycosyltransferase involved in cell wall biosynthesis
LEPEFSIIIPSYNRSQTIGRTIQSVLDQTYSDFEIWVVDDGSTDNTSEILSHYPTVRYILQSNQGVCAARNKGAKEAQGKWLVFLDSDDELMPTALEEFSAGIRSFPESKLFQTGFKKPVPNAKKTEDFPASSHKYSPPLSGTFVIKSELFLELGGYDESLRYAENMELFFRLSERDIFPHLIESMGLLYHESASGGSKNLMGMDFSLRSILEKHSAQMNSKDVWNLNQTLGVIQLRRGEFKEAQKSLKKALVKRPFEISTIFRYIISLIPFLSKRIYKPDFSKA